MSDEQKNNLRLAAEARRAKILAREKDRLIAAKGEKPATPLSPDGSDGAPSSASKERPLAARRNKVIAASPTGSTDSLGSLASKSAPDTPSAERKLEPSLTPGTDDEVAEASGTETTEVKADGGSTEQANVQKRAIDRINEEVAENTAKFDKTYKVEKPVDNSKALTTAGTKKAPKASWTASQVMKFVRLVIVIVLGSIVGYLSGTSNANMKALELMLLVHRKSEKSEYGSSSRSSGQESLEKLFGSNSGEEQGGRFTATLLKSSITTSAFPLSLLDVSLLAVLIIWGLSRQIQPSVEKLFGAKAKGSTTIIGFLLSIFNNGFSVILEGLLSYVSEFALYGFVVLLSGAVTTHFLAGSTGSAADASLKEL